MNLPPIFTTLAGSLFTLASAPAAGQVPVVNAAGTAWTLRTPAILDVANTFSTRQTIGVDEAFHSIGLTFTPPQAASTVGSGQLGVSSTLNTDGTTYNNVFSAGVNNRCTGGVVVAGVQAIRIGLESNYLIGAGPVSGSHVVEWHLPSWYTTGGVERRPFSGYAKIDGTYTEQGLSADVFSLYNPVTEQTLCTFDTRKVANVKTINFNPSSDGATLLTGINQVSTAQVLLSGNASSVLSNSSINLYAATGRAYAKYGIASVLEWQYYLGDNSAGTNESYAHYFSAGGYTLTTVQTSFAWRASFNTNQTGWQYQHPALAAGAAVFGVRGRSGQTGDLQQWQATTNNTTWATVAYIDSAGKFVTTAGVTLSVAGGGLSIKEGSNATCGTATLSGGTVVVSTTKVTANSRILLTVNGGTLTNVGSPYVSARTAGTSFTIASTNASDASTVAWLIVEPA